MSRALSQREKQFLIGGSIALTVLALIFGLVLPYRSAMSDLERNISAEQKRLEQVVALGKEYRTVKARLERLQKDRARSDKPPLAYLEEAAIRIAGRDNLVLMRPLASAQPGEARLESIEFRLQRLKLEQVLRLLWEIERPQAGMWVDTLLLRQRYDNAAQLDVLATVSAARRG
jgi:general secretion pathway protein M